MERTNHTLVSWIAQWLLAAVVFFFPWQARIIVLQGEINYDPWEYGTLSVYAVDGLVIAFLLFAAAHIFMERGHLRLTITNILALGMLVIAFFSLMYASDRTISLFWFVKLVEAVLLLLFIPQSGADTRLLSWSLSLSALVQSGIALMQFQAQEILPSTWLGLAWQHPETLGVAVVEAGGERILRAYGLLPHPNILGGFLVIGALVTLGLFVTERDRFLRTVQALALLVIGAGLWASFSRQAILALGVTIAFVVLYQFAYERTFPRITAIGTAILLVPLLSLSLLYPHLVSSRVSATDYVEQQSLSERADLLEQSKVVVQQRLFAGVGIGGYTGYLYAVDEAHNVQLPGYTYQPVHSLYLLVLAELGIAGLLTLILLVCSVIHSAVLRNALQLTWLSAVCALLIIGLFDHYLWSLHAGILLFWLVLALAIHSFMGTEFDKDFVNQ